MARVSPPRAPSRQSVAEASAGRPTFLIEHYQTGIRESDFLDAARRVADAVGSLSAKGRAIEFLHYTVVPEEGSAFCVVAASDVALVEEAYRLAGVEFERLVRAVESGS